MSETDKSKVQNIDVVVAPGQDAGECAAAAVLAPALASTLVALHWTDKTGGGLPLMGVVRTLQTEAAKVNSGDMSSVEARLLSQATACDLLFAEMSRRAALNLRDYPDAFDRYMKIALKAQNQSRMTLETLGNIKNPRIVYAKQANIANGPQQVNNGVHANVGDKYAQARAHGTENETTPSKLVEAQIETPMDPRTAVTARQTDSQLATVAPLNRAADGGR